MEKYNNRSEGFTLIELLIVVVILGILAAVVIPALSDSTDDAKLSARDSNLSSLQSSILMYKQQHNAYPGETDATGSGCPVGSTGGTGTAGTGLSLADQLSMYTNVDGIACTLPSTAFKYGPYIKTDTPGVNAIPINAISDSRAVEIVSTGNLAMTSSAAGGWKYDYKSGKIIHND